MIILWWNITMINFRLLTAHPASVGETYFGHLCFAFSFGGSMLAGGAACILHGILPFLCTASGSRRVRALHAKLSHHPQRKAMMELGPEGFNWTI